MGLYFKLKTMKKGIYLFLALLIVACSTDDNNNIDDNNNVDDTQAEWLYVHTAIEANATNSTTLVMPVTNDIFAFTDRPDREHKYISAYEFVSYWSEDATNSFQFDPPNAVFTSVNDDGVAEVEVVIIDASTDGDNITYTIQNPKLTENATFEDVSLFVDGGDTGNDNLAIGQWYQGGVIFYIFQSGDTGYVAGETHGLIAAPYDSWTGIWPFYGYEHQWTSAGETEDETWSFLGTSAGIGTGLQNTNAIIAAAGSSTWTAAYITTLFFNGDTDWYLPSKDELNQMYLRRGAIDATAKANGGEAFVNHYIRWYWSSTEHDSSGAYMHNFIDGAQIHDQKWNMAGVRPIRAF
jgi:hypothetical protein